MSEVDHGPVLHEVTFQFYADGGVGIGHAEALGLDELKQLLGALSLVVLGIVHRRAGREGVSKYLAALMVAANDLVYDLEQGTMGGTVIDRLADEEEA